MKNLYWILGVRPSATAGEIKSAYRQKALQHHPDRDGNQERFAEITQAYKTLSDSQTRGQYDAERAAWLQRQGAVGCPACGAANRLGKKPGAPVCAQCKAPLPVEAPAPFHRTKQKILEKTVELAEDTGGILAAEVGELVLDGINSGFDRLRSKMGLGRRRPGGAR